jgi:hypothetical protein
VKLVVILQSDAEVPPMRFPGTDILQLVPPWASEINQYIDFNQMLYDPWMETAATFVDLRKSLLKRGYTNLPLHANIEFGRCRSDDCPVQKIRKVVNKNLMIQRGAQ